MHPHVAKKLQAGDRIRFRDGRRDVEGMVEGTGALGINVRWANGATDSLPLGSACWQQISFVPANQIEGVTFPTKFFRKAVPA